MQEFIKIYNNKRGEIIHTHNKRFKEEDIKKLSKRLEEEIKELEKEIELDEVSVADVAVSSAVAVSAVAVSAVASVVVADDDENELLDEIYRLLE